MSYPTVTIKRSARLMNPKGIGQGRMTEGTITGAFRTFNNFPAGSFGLKSIRTVILNVGTIFRAGTPVIYATEAQVESPGSPGNSVSISCRCIEAGTVACGVTPSYKEFRAGFASTPNVIMRPGSPISGGLDTADLGGTPSAFWVVYSVETGSFQCAGTPSVTAYYQAIGPGSAAIDFMATGP